MKYLMILAALLGCCVPLPGCAFIRPTTQVGVNPFTRTVEVYNTKDVDISVGHVEAITKDGGSLTLDDLVISDKASPVIEANVGQMLAFVEQQKAANEGIRIVMQNLADVIREAGYLTNPVAASIRAALDGLAK